jgi:hypothetical protein
MGTIMAAKKEKQEKPTETNVQPADQQLDQYGNPLPQDADEDGNTVGEQPQPGKYVEFNPDIDDENRFLSKMVEQYLHDPFGFDFDTVFENTLLIERVRPMSFSQRLRRGIIMRKFASKIAMARKRALMHRASEEKLKARARKHAIMILRARILRDRSYADLTVSEKIALDQRLMKIPDSVIDRIARKQLGNVRQAENERVTNLHKANYVAIESFSYKFLNRLIEEFGDSPDKRLQSTDTLVAVYRSKTPGEEGYQGNDTTKDTH